VNEDAGTLDEENERDGGVSLGEAAEEEGQEQEEEEEVENSSGFASFGETTCHKNHNLLIFIPSQCR